MARRKNFFKNKLFTDFKFNNIEISKFINIIMYSGKKSISKRIVYSSFTYIRNKIKKNPLFIFFSAINNTKPLVEVKSRKIGGSNYQVPIEIKLIRRITLALRWIYSSAKKRKEKFMFIKLGNELIDAYNNKGNSVKKKFEVHRIAESNKTFSHFRLK